VADVLSAMGLLMQECHRQSLALQEAVSADLRRDPAAVARLETYQALDHATQVQDDLARLLPALAEALRTRNAAPDELAAKLRLVSLRRRLFAASEGWATPVPQTGEISFF
jgi:hypothetical protein